MSAPVLSSVDGLYNQVGLLSLRGVPPHQRDDEAIPYDIAPVCNLYHDKSIRIGILYGSDK